jgi:hypothetical protein
LRKNEIQVSKFQGFRGFKVERQNL